MKILMVATVPETIRAFLLPFADMLREGGWEVHAAAGKIGECEGLKGHFAALHHIGFSREFLTASLLAPFNAARMICLQLKEDYPIVHVHTPIAGFITRLSLSLLGARRPVIVYTVHGFHFHPMGGSLANKAFLLAEKFAAGRTEYLVIINEEDYEAVIRERFPVRRKILRIPGVGVDTSYFNPSRVGEAEINEFRRKHSIGRQSKMFVMVAEFNKGKRHVVALKAMTLLRGDAVMVFAGEGKLRKRCENLAESMGLQDRVRFIGFEKNMPVLLGASDCMVLPSIREGLPRSVMEAMSMAKPVIGSDIRGIRDLLKGGAGLLVPPDDHVALARAMAVVMDDPGKAARMGEMGRKRVRDEYDIELVKKRYMELYEEAAALAQGARLKERRRRVATSKPAKSIAKRWFDVLASAIALIFLSPLLAVIYILVRIFLGPPALYRQERPGLNGVPFTIYKFRTMKDLRDGDGNLLPDEERLTRLGHFLRRTSLDELPELFNVLKGEMSLVGPRPLLMEYLPLYSKEQRRRHEAKPGMTGWAQVSGRNLLEWEKKFELDVWYVDNWSLRLDFKIILKTVIAVLKREGISAYGEATAPRFTGEPGPSDQANGH